MGSSLRRSRRVFEPPSIRASSSRNSAIAVADPSAVELERALAGTLAADAAADPVATTAGLAQPGREVLEPRDLDLEAGLAGLRVAMEDLDDHRGAIEDIDPGRDLEVVLLGRRQIVIDEHDLGLASRLRRASRLGVTGVELGIGLGLGIGIVLGVERGVGLARAGPHVLGHVAGPAGPGRELDELALAEHDAGRELAAALGDAHDRIEPEGLGEPLELGDRRLELAVGHAGQLHRDDDRRRPLVAGRQLADTARFDHGGPRTLPDPDLLRRTRSAPPQTGGAPRRATCGRPWGW